MSTNTPSTAPSSSARGGRHRFRGRRGAHHNDPPRGMQNTIAGTSTASNGPLVLIPASVVSLNQSAPPNTPAIAGSSGNNPRGRGGSGGRGNWQGTTGIQTMSGIGRIFGGQLTRTVASNGALHADAPEFRPGQPMKQRSDTANHISVRSRRMSKSTAPDMATRTHEDIAHGLYECPICTSEVLRNSKIWSCKTCWTVFHLSCIKRWSQNEGSTQQQQQPGEDGNIPPPRQWRCPGCNLPKDDMPTSYSCWCAKEIDPKPIPGIPPHSCGQTCSKLRVPRKCPHPCELLCHAGPCPPCPHVGPALSCYCGKEVTARRCVDTDYDNGWSCSQICGDIMPCNEHTCERGCHEGLCGSCEFKVESRCYCGKVEKLLPCSARGERKESKQPNNENGSGEASIDTWIGVFDCGNLCERLFDCQKHTCKKACHEQEISTPHCPLSPDVVDHCPCGKTSLTDLDCVRTSCEDPIAHCQKKCERPLRCGHLCQQKCHSDQCLPCLETVSIICRCGRTTSSTICHQGIVEPPQCARTCKALMNCGRHGCDERCCPAEKIAGARLAAKRKMKSSNVEDFEAEHICTRVCGRQLKCGDPQHVCQELCHRGPCGSCREAIFDEIACHCGRTVLQPPLACGTQPPACKYQCNRSKTCEHPQVQHTCHMDHESCPKCPYLVQKPCMCGKSTLKNQPCWLEHISCGQTCGRRLRCGIHFCQKSCHRAGDCEDVGCPCPHLCAQKKTAAGCGHPCLEPCHAPYPCKEDRPCQAKVIITCECQHLKQEIKCLASKTTEGSPPRRTLVCDDECLRLQRNRKLALALNISADHVDDHIPYSTTTLDMVKDNSKWCQTQEREFRVFAADDSEKRLRFKPMPSNQRAFLHSLAEDFGLDSESMDPEPHRHVAIFKTPRFVSAPMKTLAQCMKIKPSAESVTASTSTIQSVEPYNALILSSPRFALTIEELRTELAADLSTAPSFSCTIAFLPSEEIVLHSKSQMVTIPTKEDLEKTLAKLKPLISKTVMTSSLAQSVALCRVDASLNVVRRDDNTKTNSGGWSQVVKGAPPLKARREAWGLGTKSSFTVLGSKLGRKGMDNLKGGGDWRGGDGSVIRDDGTTLEDGKESKGKEEKRKATREKDSETVIENWESAVDEWGL